ncbi:MAG TPA: GTP-binding protein [Nitrososphaerales archaeon]|nr:GTP-binding protein [Nitrososphaerales archaeon]
MGLPEKIKKIEDDIHKTQVNKKTEHHIGLLRAKLSRLKAEQEEQQSRRTGSRVGYDVKKSGDATVVLIGLPSVGKSTLLNRLTNAKSKVASYQFTTLEVVPGVMEFNGARIQVLDLPGIIKGASEGKGLGRRVLAVARSADLVLFVVDVFQPEARSILEKELRDAGIRIDEKPPNVVVEKTGSGGLSVSAQVKLTKISEMLIKDILRVYDVNSGRVLVREDIDDAQLVDVLARNRTYVPSLTVMNKIDLVNAGFTEELTRKLPYRFLPISAESDLNLQPLREEIYRRLDFVRIYMRRRTGETDFEEPMIVKNGTTIMEVCDKVHRDMKDDFRYAQVWGKSVRFGGQKVGMAHRLMDQDVLTIVTR